MIQDNIALARKNYCTRLRLVQNKTSQCHAIVIIRLFDSVNIRPTKVKELQFQLFGGHFVRGGGVHSFYVLGWIGGGETMK